MLFRNGANRADLAIEGYAYPPTGDIYDDNWLTVEIVVQTGSQTIRMSEPCLLAQELEAFADGIRSAEQNTNFDFTESHLSFSFMPSKGRLIMGLGPYFRPDEQIPETFEMEFSSTEELLREIDGLASRFPVRTTDHGLP